MPDGTVASLEVVTEAVEAVVSVDPETGVATLLIEVEVVVGMAMEVVGMVTESAKLMVERLAEDET